jgi:hypothetical protein
MFDAMEAGRTRYVLIASVDGSAVTIQGAVATRGSEVETREHILRRAKELAQTFINEAVL